MEVSPGDFLPRLLYRSYLADALADASRQAPVGSSLQGVHDRAVCLSRLGNEPDGPWPVGLSGGGHVWADQVVLAPGPPPPATPRLRGTSLDAEPWYVADPWQHGALEPLDPGPLLLIGTGLTMVDMAITLSSDASSVRVCHARSRHGLLPFAHDTGQDHVVTTESDRTLRWMEPAPRSAKELVQAVRVEIDKAAVQGFDWPEVISSLRGITPRVWGALSPVEQRRLARHALRYWDVRRHRMAPATGSAIADLQSTERLSVGAGRIRSIRKLASGRLRVVLKTVKAPRPSKVSGVVNCTGPAFSPTGGSVLIDQLLRAGRARPHQNGLGLDVDPAGDLVGSDGRADSTVHTIGWLRRAELLESTSVPEIRSQAEELGRRLAGQRIKSQSISP